MPDVSSTGSESRYREAHEKYRLSGLSLTTTIIGLSSGAIIALAKQIPGWALLVLFIPIALALLQQMEQYRGGLYEARAETLRATFEHPKIGEIFKKEYIEKLILTFQKTKAKADTHYGCADRLCIATVVVFILLGFGCLAYLAFCAGSCPGKGATT